MSKEWDEMTVEDWCELIDFFSVPGKAYWKTRTDTKWFQDAGKFHSVQQQLKAWNAKHAGKEITTINGRGYIQFSFYIWKPILHRLIWFIFKGKWPTNQIDHINGNRLDNRPINMREVTSEENNRNRKIPNINSSGTIGVSFCRSKSKWHARICVKGKDKHLGFFSSLEEAVATRKAAEIEYGYHENHGRK